MCCCAKPTINGEPGYSWDGKEIGVRQPYPPPLVDGDTLIYDEPGRCCRWDDNGRGVGLDSHAYHFRLVKDRSCIFHYLLVQHGGGSERIQMGSSDRPFLAVLAKAEPADRYWIMLALYHMQNKAARESAQATANIYAKAFVDGRLKKRRRKGTVRVEIMPPTAVPPSPAG